MAGKKVSENILEEFSDEVEASNEAPAFVPPVGFGGAQKGTGPKPTSVTKPASLMDLLWIRDHWTEDARGKDLRSRLHAKYKNDPLAFHADLAKAEAAHATRADRMKIKAIEKKAAAPGSSEEDDGVEDLGSEKAMQDLRRCLSDISGKTGAP